MSRLAVILDNPAEPWMQEELNEIRLDGQPTTRGLAAGVLG
jgi:hypothetical protein